MESDDNCGSHGIAGNISVLDPSPPPNPRHSCDVEESVGSRHLQSAPQNSQGEGSHALPPSYHEGFFWRCSFGGNLDDDTLLKFWITNAHSKVCTTRLPLPFPVSQQTHNATAYDSAIIYRGFWSIFMLIGVAAVVLGGFFIICAAPFASHRLYKAGGVLFLTSALFLLGVVVMYVLWVEVLDVVQVYVDHQRSSVCPTFDLTIHYGLSFFFAPVGISFCLLAGLLFLLIGRSVQMQYH
nr:transmembrane protein 182 [Salvelinus alpinus]